MQGAGLLPASHVHTGLGEGSAEPEVRAASVITYSSACPADLRRQLWASVPRPAVSEVAGGDAEVSHQVAMFSFGKKERDAKDRATCLFVCLFV